MLSVKSIGSGGGAADYYEGGLASEDYYTGGGEPPGKWVGEYAKEIGLAGEVQKGELAAGFAGFHPQTGEQIANNAGDDHKAGYDLTFSAPKSVSATWATADRETQQAISAAQQRAVEKALDYASKHAFHQRAGHAGAIKVEHASGIAVATFEHGTSRAGDPQLHTHALVLNVAENGKTIDFDTRWKHAAGAAYRAELASEMQQLGYVVLRDGASFKVEGVPAGLEKEFSTRREQIEAALREHGTAGGKAAQAAALATRQNKGEVNRAELFERAREVAKAHGFNAADVRAAQAVAPEKFDSVAFLDTATAQASTLTRQQLEKEILQAAQGSLSIDQALAKLEDLKRSGELVELRDNQGGLNRWTTRDMLQVEQRIADTAERMALEKTHPVSQASLDAAMAAKSLSDDQKQALRHITNPERISCVQGVAGAGKSYMLDAARDAWQRDGYTVRGAALAGKAAEGLQESSGIESSTIHSLVGQLDREQIKLDSKTVIVLDEAGMIGSRLYDRLQQHADAAGAKIVPVGDRQQLQPIDAGGAFRSVSERVGAVTMDEIRRQADPAQRQIVRDFKDGKAGEAIDLMEKLGQVKNYETAGEAKSGMAGAIVRDMQEGKTSIGLAGTRAEVHQINQLARGEAQQTGLVSPENHKFEAERGARQFADGDRVIFLKNDNELGVKNGTTGTVERAANGTLSVKLDTGKTVEVDGQKYNQIDHGYAMTVHKSQGVTVDRAHMMPGQMTDQHSGYVGASRHRETVQIHGTTEQIQAMRETATKSHEKDTAAEARYTPIEREPAKPSEREPQPVEQQIEKLERLRETFDRRAAELRQQAEQAKPEQVKGAQPTPDQAQPGQKQAEAAKDREQARPEPVKDREQVKPVREGEPAKDAAQAEPVKQDARPEPKPEPTKDVQAEPLHGQKQAEQAKDAQAKPEPVKDGGQVKPVPEDEQLAKDAQPTPEPKPEQVKPVREGEQPAKDAAQAERPAKDAQPTPEPKPEQVKQIREGEQPAKDVAAKQAEAPAKDSEQAKPVKQDARPEPKPEPTKDVQAEPLHGQKQAEQAKDAQAKPEPVKDGGQVKPVREGEQLAKDADAKQAEPVKPTVKQAEQQRQLKAETERHRQRQPERQAQQQRQLKAEAERHRQRQPERQPEPRPAKDSERDRGR